MELPALIAHLETSILPLRDKGLLLAALADLHKAVGMASLKQAVVDQLLFFLSNIREKGVAQATDGHCLHTILYGPPGVGKTMVGSILARIWSALGILTSPAAGSTISSGGSGSCCGEEMTLKLLRDNVNFSIERKLADQKIDRALTAAGATRHKIKELRSKVFACRTRRQRKPRSEDLYTHQLEEDIQKIARLSSDALNYCEMTARTLEEDLGIASVVIVNPPATPTNDLFKIVSRSDFVAEYLGQSAPKTKKLLAESKGKVLLVDEAYSLYQGDRDSFGSEVLTVINQYMTEHADSTVLIFAGYKDMLQSSVFKAQPGLQRRFGFTFEILSYTPAELAQIFQQQLTAGGWTAPDPENLVKFFTDNYAAFPAFGGDTNRLLFQYKMVHSSRHWNGPVVPRAIQLPLLQEAFTRYLVHQPLDQQKIKMLAAQRTYDEDSLTQRIKEFQERQQHEALYEEARAAERGELKRKLRKQKQEDEYDKRDAPSGMYM